MTETLRPMGLGEILDRTFHIYRLRFFTFVAVAALPAVAMLLLETANQFWWKLLPDEYAPRIFLWLTPQNLLYSVVLRHPEILLNLALWPVFSLLVSRDLFGEQLSASAALAQGRLRWRSLIGLSFANLFLPLVLPELLLAGLLAGTAYLLLEVLKFHDDDPMMGRWMFVAALVIGWVVFEWLSAGLTLSLPVWMLEEFKIRPALRRAWRLSSHSRLRIVFVRVMPHVIGAILTVFGNSLLLFLLYSFLRHTHYWWTSYRNTTAGTTFFVDCMAATFVGPIFPIALTLIYYDQRIRLEGYDIEWMMDAAGMNEPATKRVPTTPADPVTLEDSQG